MLADDVRLTDDGVVVFGCGFMHPETFKDMMGEAAWQELLSRPRIPSLYPELED